MLALSGLGLAAWIVPFLAAAPEPAPGPGRVVLAAEPLDGAASDPTSSARVLVVLEDPGPGADATALVASSAARSDAADRALAEALGSARAIELRGGTWLGWYQAAHADRHERAWTRALRRAHAGGSEVRASGAAAAWIARWSVVPRAVLDKPAQVPHDTSLDLTVEGLGLFDGPLVGVLTPGAPTADRVVERAVEVGFGDVLLLAGPAEFVFEAEARVGRFRMPSDEAGGPPAWSAWIDLRAGMRSRGSVRGARATLPRDGDVYDLRTGTLAGAATLREDPRDEPGVARLLAELEGRSDTDGERKIPPRVRNVRASRDESAARSSHGGLCRLPVDLELALP